MDLSKAYDCLPHDLIIAKLEVYGLDTNSLRFIFDCLSSRRQRPKIGCSYSTWSKVLCGIPQGSILAPLIFNIFINDIFFFIEKSEICNFADGSTLYSCDRNLLRIKENLTFDMKNILLWFRTHSLRANAEKFQFMILNRKNHRRQRMVINSITVKESNEVILLGITTDNKLVFKKHIENLCRTAQYKLHALTRIRKYLTLDKAILLGNTFISSQFNYTPLIWMFSRKILCHKIEKNHHRTLKVIYQSEESYENLLLESSSVSLHQRHLRFLVTEIYKSATQINPEFMWPYFTYNSISYNLRKGPILYLPSTHSTYYSTNSVHFRGSLIWNNLPRDVKSSKSLSEFKTKIKNFGNIDCRCVICS